MPAAVMLPSSLAVEPLREEKEEKARLSMPITISMRN